MLYAAMEHSNRIRIRNNEAKHVAISDMIKEKCRYTKYAANSIEYQLKLLPTIDIVSIELIEEWRRVPIPREDKNPQIRLRDNSINENPSINLDKTIQFNILIDKYDKLIVLCKYRVLLFFKEMGLAVDLNRYKWNYYKADILNLPTVAHQYVTEKYGVETREHYYTIILKAKENYNKILNLNPTSEISNQTTKTTIEQTIFEVNGQSVEMSIRRKERKGYLYVTVDAVLLLLLREAGLELKNTEYSYADFSRLPTEPSILWLDKYGKQTVFEYLWLLSNIENDFHYAPVDRIPQIREIEMSINLTKRFSDGILERVKQLKKTKI